MKATTLTGKLLLAIVAAMSLASSAVSADSQPDTLSVDLTDYEGKVVILDFWASWCVPCRRSFPWLDKMQHKYREQGLVVIGVNLDAEPAAAESFLRDYPVSFRIVRDEGAMLARRYDVIAMPSSYIIDRDGAIAVRHLGFKTARVQEYEAALRTVLEQSESVATIR